MDMNKTKLIILGIVALLATVGVAYAVNYYTINQTLTVPTVIQLFRSDTTTPIATGADISALWTYNAGSFSLTFDIKNPGAAPVTPTVTVGAVSGWTFSTTSLTSIAAGANLLVTVTATPPNTNPGTTSGAFAISVGA
jgi:hypothetical protein